MIRKLVVRQTVDSFALRGAAFPLADNIAARVDAQLDHELASLARLRYVDGAVLSRDLLVGNSYADDFLRNLTAFVGLARVRLSAKPHLKRRRRPVSWMKKNQVGRGRH